MKFYTRMLLFFILSTSLKTRVVYIGKNSEIGNGEFNNPYNSLKFALKYIIELSEKTNFKFILLNNLFDKERTTLYEISKIIFEIEYLLYSNFFFLNIIRPQIFN